MDGNAWNGMPSEYDRCVGQNYNHVISGFTGESPNCSESVREAHPGRQKIHGNRHGSRRAALMSCSGTAKPRPACTVWRGSFPHRGRSGILMAWGDAGDGGSARASAFDGGDFAASGMHLPVRGARQTDGDSTSRGRHFAAALDTAASGLQGAGAKNSCIRTSCQPRSAHLLAGGPGFPVMSLRTGRSEKPGTRTWLVQTESEDTARAGECPGMQR